MAKDRLKDTFTYLEARAGESVLPNLKNTDITSFKTLVETNDVTNNGAVLSLNWSWYNTRPSEDLRHAIRAYLLASIYNQDIVPAGTGAEATRVKLKTAQWFHQKTSERLSEVLGLSDRVNTKATYYKVGAIGHGTQRAQAVCRADNLPVQQVMHASNEIRKTAVVVIDMQAGSDVGQLRLYGNHSVLEYQQAVLRKAAELKMIVYDIVIDPADAAEWGSAYALPSASLHKKSEIMARQRRLSYAEGARTKTIGLLRNLYPGTQLRHIPKPSHPSFAGTLFAEHLEADGIEAVVVMGYDANQCVKATVFGVPSETREEAKREPTATEVEAVMDLHPDLTVQEAQKRATPMNTVTTDYTPGLLDRGLRVITSRCILASDYKPLDAEWAMLSGHR